MARYKITDYVKVIKKNISSMKYGGFSIDKKSAVLHTKMFRVVDFEYNRYSDGLWYKVADESTNKRFWFLERWLELVFDEMGNTLPESLAVASTSDLHNPYN